MNKKLPIIMACLATLLACFAVYVAIYGTGKQAKDTNSLAARTFSPSVASDAAERMETLCCGTVSGSEITFDQSAFHMDFVPQEPEYVERFRYYEGVTADFVPVLMYHFFYDANVDVPTKGTNSHSIQSVEQQLQWLWENGYVTLTMDELYEWMNNGIELPAKCVLLTSDDGQDNFFDLLQPLLHKYGFVATSFVITSYRENIPYKRTLPNIEMHSHTHNMHRGSAGDVGFPGKWGIMQIMPVQEGVADLTTSQEILGGSQYFAYPFGNFGGNSKEILAQAGFRMAFTTQYGAVRRGYDLYELPRLRVSGSLDISGFKALLGYQKVMKKYESS